MNIFVLHEDPVAAATAHCDKHVVKMALEYAQIVSTVLRGNGCRAAGLYKATHTGHPCVTWASATRGNFDWLMRLWVATLEEYEHRYERCHASGNVHATAIANRKAWPERTGMDPWAQCMPEQFRGPNAVVAYRAYYKADKARFAKWTRRDAPDWW